MEETQGTAEVEFQVEELEYPLVGDSSEVEKTFLAAT